MADKGIVIRAAGLITRAQVQASVMTTVWVFGDNMSRRGHGGQAYAMRGEPNTIGVPTKWAPGHTPGDYFRDEDWKNRDVRHAIMAAFDSMRALLILGRNIAIPGAGLGTGRAELPTRAPSIYAEIERLIASLEEP